MSKKSEKKFAAFDIDGTLFRSGLYREVFFELIRMKALPENLHSQLAEKETAWQKRSHGSAFKEFDQSLAELFDSQLPSLKIAYFDLAAERVIAQHKDNVYVYTRELIKDLKKQGYYLVAISGSQTELVEPFAQHYGFDNWIGQYSERGDEFFTGHVRKTHKAKDVFLKKLIKTENLSTKNSIAVGDSAGDIEMLELAETAIAFNPEKRLFEHAKKNHWKIVVERKNTIYQLEYKNGEYTVA
jgi:HAD superfamily hydrolase (TIGR01490 family)